jgi:hypothetical protein
MIVETHDFGSESHISKVAERKRGIALYCANPVPTTPMCSFVNAVVNNDANLWTITRLDPANDELGATIR